MFVGIDIGGTSTRIASSSSLENIKIENRFEFKNTHDFDSDFGMIVKTIKNIANKVSSIGIGIPGDLGLDKTIVKDTTHNHEYENISFLETLKQTFNCKAFMDNDGAAAALGVAYYDNSNKNDFEYITWGTGIGGASVRWTNGRAIATKLDWDINFDSWEDVCGGRKLEQRFGKTGDKLTDKEWGEVMGDFKSYLSEFVARNKCSNIVFGGGVATKQKDRLMNLKLQNVRLSVSGLGEDTGLYGAFALAKGIL